MKKVTTLLYMLCIGVSAVHAQTPALNNDAATIFVETGGTLYIEGKYKLTAGSTHTNNGNVIIKGNIENDAVMPAAGTGKTILNGTSKQDVLGMQTFFTHNLQLDNAAGFELIKSLKTDAVCEFTSGIVLAPTNAEPLWFTSTGSISGTAVPTNTAHVNGWVQKDGTGPFEYPVGSGTSYQKVKTDLTANATGMLVKYNVGSGGGAIYSSLGTDPIPLVAVNQNEHWLIEPKTTATGKVTVYWDSPVEFGAAPGFTIRDYSRLKVAHYHSSAWQNEGHASSGSNGAGYVESNTISTWSPFSLGALVLALPIQWLDVQAKLINNNDAAQVTFTVNESDVVRYDIEKSSDGINFSYFASIKSKGNGTHTYSLVDHKLDSEKSFYRIKQIESSSAIASKYSKVVSVVTLGKAYKTTIFPNPATGYVNLIIKDSKLINSRATLYDEKGARIMEKVISNFNESIDLRGKPAGVYYLQLANGQSIKFISLGSK